MFVTGKHPKQDIGDRWLWSVMSLTIVGLVVVGVNVSTDDPVVSPTAIYCVSDSERVWVSLAFCRAEVGSVPAEKLPPLNGTRKYHSTMSPRLGYSLVFVPADTVQPSEFGATVTNGLPYGYLHGDGVSYNGPCAAFKLTPYKAFVDDTPLCFSYDSFLP